MSAFGDQPLAGALQSESSASLSAHSLPPAVQTAASWPQAILFNSFQVFSNSFRSQRENEMIRLATAAVLTTFCALKSKIVAASLAQLAVSCPASKHRLPPPPRTRRALPAHPLERQGHRRSPGAGQGYAPGPSLHSQSMNTHAIIAIIIMIIIMKGTTTIVSTKCILSPSLSHT